jgi:hypothetical protein
MISRMSIAALAVLVAASAFAAPPDSPAAKSFAQDPHWQGVNNRIAPKDRPAVTQDFGYSTTNFAGQAKGEIGGRVTRSATPCFYAAALPKPLTLDDPLSASGTFAITSSSGGAGLFFGFFNSDQPGGSGRPIGSLGLDVDGEHGGARLAVRLITSHNTSAGTFITPFEKGFRPTPIRNDGTRYTWSLSYDPHANHDNGQLRFTIKSNRDEHEDWESKPFTVDLPPGYKAANATFTHFGLMNLMKAGGTFTFYAADLTVNGVHSDFSADPKWVAFKNRSTYAETMQVGAHDFGYSPDTHCAGGQPGEIGGTFWRIESTPAYYAAPLARPVTIDQPLRAAGKVNFLVGGPDSDMYIGWFATDADAAHPKSPIDAGSFLGVHVGGPTRVGHYFQPAYATPKNRAHAPDGPVLNPGKPSTWSLSYDPAGDGSITVALDDKSTTFPLRKGAKSNFTPFTHFGLVTAPVGGQSIRLYLDDLQFTGGPSNP